MQPVRFTTDDEISLEGELRVDGVPRGSAVVCHPHPRHGGSKDHPLLWAIRNELAHRGFAVLAFNFRGVMGSDGTYGGGRDEVRDVRAAVSRVGEEAPAGPTFVCGWSFGAHVALREAIDDLRVAGLALVGLPLYPHDAELPRPPSAEVLRDLRRPVLLVAGESDEFCPPDDLKAFAAGFPHVDVTILPGTDHFFWRREKEAAAVVGEAAERVV